MSIKKDISQSIGKTSLVALNNLVKKEKLKANIFAKVESSNPGGSIKDRAALAMINKAEKEKNLKMGGTIIEPTSGNTGIAIALLAQTKGYKAILTMPETMSLERRNLLKALGAKVVLTPGAEGMQGSIDKAQSLLAENPNAVILGQFDNPANPEAHRLTTGPEIWADTNGEIDIFVASVGTGGTITGTGESLKEFNPDIKVVAVEPKESPLLSKGYAGPHGIQGIGANFVPKILNRDILDEIIAISTPDAKIYARLLLAEEGIFAGISSGASLAAAITLARKKENQDKNIVLILPDSGERYLSTDTFI